MGVDSGLRSMKSVLDTFPGSLEEGCVTISRGEPRGKLCCRSRRDGWRVLVDAEVAAMFAEGLSKKEIIILVNKYIGVSGGYLSGFSYQSHREFYPVHCDLDIDPEEYEGKTTRERFISVLSSVDPPKQAKILRGVLEICPVGQEYAVETRTAELRDEFLKQVARLESVQGVDSPIAVYSVEVVRRAITDAEALVKANGATSGVDRVHTALHGYIINICESSGIPVQDGASLAAVFKLLRDRHPSFVPTGPRANDITHLLKSCAAILDCMSPLRNQASMAHPNENLLAPEEAMFVINVAKSVLHYLHAKLPLPKK
jgi:hypothetical protein